MNFAIVLAGGSGKRMKSNVKKQYIELEGRPLIYYTLKAFEHNDTVDGIIVVTSKEDIEYMNVEIIKKYEITKIKGIVEGGKERYNSVYNALCFIENKYNQCDYVAIHDGARPFINGKIIEESFVSVKEHMAVVSAVRVKDTIKKSDCNNCVEKTIPRDNLWQIQTPQTFNFEMLKKAYDKMFEKGDEVGVTDDAMVWEMTYLNKKIYISEGNYFNIKVTTPEDLVYARAILECEKC